VQLGVDNYEWLREMKIIPRETFDECLTRVRKRLTE
jgi:hypothetical protein